MDAKTYRVKNMRQALDLIRSELGPEASVLHSRRVRLAGVAGWLTGQTELEVVASTQVDVPSRFPQEGEPWLAKAVGKASPQREPDEAPAQATTPTAAIPLLDPDAAVPLSHARQVDRVGRRLTEGGFSLDQIQRAVKSLLDERFDFARAPWSEVLDETLIEIAALCPLGKSLRWQPGHSHWVALVGPTGVGKTTTIAKLAAGFARSAGISVGLVTVDTARVGGSEQLAAYAEVFDIPLSIIDSVEEMQRLAPELTEQHDLVLVDTGGFSPRQQDSAQRLRDILAAARPDEIQLVISGSMSPAAIHAAGDQFQSLGLTGSILSKLDETPALAEVWPAVQQLNLPLSYLTTGQRVPEDLESATLEQIMTWLKRAVRTPEDANAEKPGREEQPEYASG